MNHKLVGVIYNDRCVVMLDGNPLDPGYSQAIMNHSPDGFSWGYEGSGPAQLALAIMLEITGQSVGYQAFKRNVIARLPFNNDFDITFSDEELMGHA